MLRDHSQLDEGFSEETRSQSDSDMNYQAEGDTSAGSILAMLVNLPVEQRAQVVEAIFPNLSAETRYNLAATLIRTLPNTDKESLGGLCERLTKFDPVYTLPNELMLQVLSYLGPKELLFCSRVSKAWRPRTMDEKLWRGCYAREGWVVDSAKMTTFEERERRKIMGGKSPKTARGAQILERKGSRKRKTEEAFNEGEAVTGVASDSMEGVEVGSLTVTGNGEGEASITRRGSTDSGVSMRSTTNDSQPSDLLQISPPLFRPGSSSNNDPKLSWPYLYKQRCRLELNWEKGVFKKFSLPHPLHPEEGHTECVYTIQHTPQYLVSGSRDQTIRIWDLETRRLVRQPLRGHEASVLCLQFDDRPDHDIIVSGGSDSYVIVWRFSTGEILAKLTTAHHESVLNLRFDDNYIVTCSKDKLIKVWNRRAVPRDSPLVPPHLLPTLPPLDPTSEETNLIKPYTLLTTLRGHQAAVNAVIIHNSTIVSASGDRTIKSWNLPSGKLNKTYIGHTKGIACVQFDGRRIVSGSSDNTVRIFDAENQAEVACLSQHANLVRTVQARFGDLDTTSVEELEQEAAVADKAYFDALQRGMQPASVARGARRNAGSARPEKMLSTGTKVPPGGGGGRWAKIVSGSYDETVKVWRRKGREGEWEVDRVLPLREEGSTPGSTRGGAHGRGLNRGPAGGLAQLQALQMQHQPGPAPAPAATNLPPPHHQQPAPAPPAGPTNLPPHAPNQPPPGPPVPFTAAGHPHLPHVPLPAHHVPRPTHGGNGNGGHHDSNRVFKLQFDARRIVCCSQSKVIVGWDFANGERELELVGGWGVETA